MGAGQPGGRGAPRPTQAASRLCAACAHHMPAPITHSPASTPSGDERQTHSQPTSASTAAPTPRRCQAATVMTDSPSVPRATVSRGLP